MTFAFERGAARAQNRRSENSSLLGSPNSENVEPPLKVTATRCKVQGSIWLDGATKTTVNNAINVHVPQGGWNKRNPEPDSHKAKR